MNKTLIKTHFLWHYSHYG